jgi:hypothetical protein
MMEGRRQRFGTFQSIDVLGTLRGPEGGMQTTVRLNFSGGGATNIYTWDRSGHIMDIGARPYQSIELVPAANGEFRTFDPRTGAGARLSLVGSNLTAATSAGPVTIRRRMQ